MAHATDLSPPAQETQHGQGAQSLLQLPAPLTHQCWSVVGSASRWGCKEGAEGKTEWIPPTLPTQGIKDAIEKAKDSLQKGEMFSQIR